MGPLRKFTPPPHWLYFGATPKFYLLWRQALQRQMSSKATWDRRTVDVSSTAPQIADGIAGPPKSSKFVPKAVVATLSEVSNGPQC